MAAMPAPEVPAVNLNDVIARMGWAARTVRTQPLSGGITNVNYRVDVDGESFFVRLPGKDSENLGIHRRREYECNMAACEAGVAPSVAAFFEDAGVLVIKYVHGRNVTEEEMHQPQTLARVAARHGATPAQVALAWLLRQEDMMVIPKATNLAHVRENREAVDLALSEADLAELDKAFPPPRGVTPLEML